ncbi:hypothetical protein DFH01_11840 [Falsiroseomonas bella]|uniref:Uncharacterized protein n=1 Tax=Falsiroseomonas bella TaxID=2184016 RepID=A0A317FG20_9PROT|nr:hypothetical protein [Falsiroseomonas bella]PWS37513.1 hypothetical protein DFH01_11840 [Falsiroseomonas bella]
MNEDPISIGEMLLIAGAARRLYRAVADFLDRNRTNGHGTFREHADSVKHFTGYIEASHATLSPVRLFGLSNTIAVHALQMARRITKDDIPRGVSSQLYVYSRPESSLQMWLSSGAQSFGSVLVPWTVPREGEGSDAPGICVRAFCSNRLWIKKGDFEQRDGDPLKEIMALPIVPRLCAQDNDLAALTVSSRTVGFFPDDNELHDGQRARIKVVQEILQQLNAIYRNLSVSGAGDVSAPAAGAAGKS